MKKTFKIVMLPTEKASSIVFEDDDPIKKLHICPTERQHEKWNYQHLYIISDDEIKEGDWVLNKETNEIYQRKHYNNGKSKLSEQEKKIVATTDKSLGITDHRVSPVPNFCDMPQIPESFIQAYIKAYNDGHPITEVDLEIEQYNIGKPSYYVRDRIKTRADNTVIINSMEEETYTKKDLEIAYNVGYKRRDKPFDSCSFDEWFNENY